MLFRSWVHEGYATYVEGRLTGRGRPNSDLRASILRRWAVAGRLPAYGALAQDWESYLGMSMAYLVGSSYLEWLVDRSGPESLRHLWARLSAHTNRDFDTAFGVMQDVTENDIFGDHSTAFLDLARAAMTAGQDDVARSQLVAFVSAPVEHGHRGNPVTVLMQRRGHCLGDQ